MSMISKLDVFTLKIREKGKREDFLNFNDIAGFNLIDEIFQYLSKNIYLFKIDNQTERTSRIEKNELDVNDLYCRIKIGKFGERSEIVDTLSGSGVFHKEKEHSDTIPLFFHMHVSENYSKAIFHIQRVGNRTLMPEIKNILNTVLSSLRPDKFIYELRPLKVSMSISDFLNKDKGQISSINLVLKDKNENEFLEPTILTLRSKSRKNFPETMINRIIETSISKNLENLEDLMPKKLKNIDIDTAIVELNVQDRGKIKVKITETISLQNSINLLTKTAELDKTGYVSFAYLKSFSKKNMK